MPYSSYTADINCKFEVLWNFLLDKIAHPDHYISTLVDYKVEQKSPTKAIRMLKTEQFSLRELVEFNIKTKEVTYTLLEHPKYEGTIMNRLLEQKNKKGEEILTLTITLDWRLKGEKENDFDKRFDEMIKEAVLRIKKVIES